jgi:hypothetical protein
MLEWTKYATSDRVKVMTSCFLMSLRLQLRPHQGYSQSWNFICFFCTQLAWNQCAYNIIGDNKSKEESVLLDNQYPNWTIKLFGLMATTLQLDFPFHYTTRANLGFFLLFDYNATLSCHCSGLLEFQREQCWGRNLNFKSIALRSDTVNNVTVVLSSFEPLKVNH